MKTVNLLCLIRDFIPCDAKIIEVKGSGDSKMKTIEITYSTESANLHKITLVKEWLGVSDE